MLGAGVRPHAHLNPHSWRASAVIRVFEKRREAGAGRETGWCPVVSQHATTPEAAAEGVFFRGAGHGRTGCLQVQLAGPERRRSV